MLKKTLPLLVILVIGLVLKHLKLIKKEDGRVLSTLLMSVLVPAAIINSISTAALTPSLLLLPLTGITVVGLLLGLGIPLVYLLGLQEARRGAFLISFPTMECGSLGYAMMAAAFGAGGLRSIVAFDVGQACCFFLGIPLLASYLEPKHFYTNLKGWRPIAL